jgi:hypothetical protein
MKIYLGNEEVREVSKGGHKQGRKAREASHIM